MAGACRHGAASPASLADLVSRRDAYEGRLVVVEGVVRSFDDGGHAYYVVEDAAHHRVGLRPAEAAARYLSKAVEVTGAFRFDPAAGRFIQVVRIAPLPAGKGGP